MKVEEGFNGEDVISILLGEEIGSFAEDGFDSSSEESHIFSDVAHGTITGGTRNSCGFFGTEGLQTEEAMRAKAPICSNYDDVDLTRFTYMRHLSREDVQWAEVNIKGSTSGAGSDARNVNGKRKESTSMEHLSRKNKDPRYCLHNTASNLYQLYQSKLCPSKSMQNHDSVCKKVPGCIAESFARSISSTYYQSNCPGGMDGAGDAHTGTDLETKHIDDCSRDDRRVLGVKSVTSTSFSSGLPVASMSTAPEGTPAALVCSGNTPAEHNTLNSDVVDVLLKNGFVKEMPTRLHSQAHQLLLDVGWIIEPRKRSDRTKLAYSFISPEGICFRALSQAWKTCGDSFLADASRSEQDGNGREWMDVNVFWDDLAETLSYIEKDNQQENSLSPIERWQMLDPFMAVVLIDRRISALREGKAVRAVKSATSFLHDRNNMLSKDENIDQLGEHIAKHNICMLGSLSQSSLPAIGRDCKSEHDSQQVISKEVAHQLQNKSRCGQEDQKLCSLGKIQKRSLKSQARRVGKGLSDTKYLRNKNCEALLGQYKKLIRPVSKSVSNLQKNGLASHLSSKLLVGNQSCQGTNVDQLMRICHPKVKMLSEESSEYGEGRVQYMPARAIMSDSIRVASDWQRNLEFSIHKEFSPIAQKDLSMVEEVVGQGASIGVLDLTPAAKPIQNSNKKARKRSKKISEIKAADANNNGMQGSSKGDFGCSLADGIINHSDLLFHQVEESTFRRESTPECAGRLEFIKKHSGNVGNASKTKKVQASAVGESNSTKKSEKSEPRAARQNAEDKKINPTMHLEDERRGKLLNVDRPQEDAAIYKSIKRSSSNKSSSVNISLQKVPSGSRKVRNHCMDSTESVVATDDGYNLMLSHGDGSNEVMIPFTGAPPDPQETQINSNTKKPKVHTKDGQKKLRVCHIDDDDLLIAAIIKNKDISSSRKHFASKIRASHSKELVKLKSQRGSCKLLLRTPGKGGKHSMDKKRFILEAKTVLCWLIEMGVVSLKDTVQYRNPKDNEVVKDGWITKDGILCNCCTNVLSVSDFKAHAGFKLHKPCLNLFLQSDKPYTLCQLKAWSTEYKARKSHMHIGVEEVDQNDDTCGLCGDGGELICCDNCPSTYHQMCLPSQELPEGSWYCSNCICKICGEVVKQKEASSSIASLECSQCEHKYHDTCIKEKINTEVGSCTWFCRESCQKVYSGLRSRVGVLNNIGDEFSWTILRCSHNDQKVHSAQRIAAMAECNVKLTIALNIMEECFLPMVDPRTGIDMIPHVLYNWGSNFARLNYQGFYTVVLEKGDELISVASIRLHGVTAAEMPLIATSSEHRRQGMCRRLIIAIEKMLISFKVKMLVLSAIPELVGTWTTGFGFKPIEDDDKQQLKNINLMLFPGTSLLKKDLCEAMSQESGLTSTSSASNGTGDIDLYSVGDQSKNFGGSDEKTISEIGLLPVENVKIDQDEPPLIMKMTEYANGEQIDQLSSCENFVLTAKHNEHDVNNAEFFNGQIRTSSLYENDQVFSTKKTASTVMSVSSIYADVHSCSSSFSPASKNNSLNDSSSMQTLEIIGNKEETTLENSNSLVENSDAMKKERKASVGDIDVENNKEILMLQNKKGCSLSDKQTEEHSLYVGF